MREDSKLHELRKHNNNHKATKSKAQHQQKGKLSNSTSTSSTRTPTMRQPTKDDADGTEQLMLTTTKKRGDRKLLVYHSSMGVNLHRTLARLCKAFKSAFFVMELSETSGQSCLALLSDQLAAWCVTDVCDCGRVFCCSDLRAVAAVC